MKHSDYLKKKKNKETRKKIVSVISAIVVFITTYALVLPAITLDVNRASQEPGIAFEQMQFKATASAAAVTAAENTTEEPAVEVQAEETQVEETKEEGAPAEEAAPAEETEASEEESSAEAAPAEEVKEEETVEETPAETVEEETPAEETEESNEDAAAADQASSESSSSESKSSESAEKEETQTTEAQTAEAATVDQTSTETAETAETAATEEAAAEFQIPELDALDFDDILTDKTNFYFYHVEDAEEAENLSSDSVDDWNKVGSDTVLAPEDFVRVYLSYEIPAGALNETNAVARYTLPEGMELTDKQIEAINKYENGIAAAASGSDHDKYLGAEAIEGTRTPDEKAGDEYISATVKVDKVHKNGEDWQELVFTFIPYTVEKNQISYDEVGEVTSEGKKVKGFFTFDLTTSQIDFEKTNVETVENEDGTTDEIQYSEAEVVFVKEDKDQDIDEISRTLTLAAPAEEDAEDAEVAEQKTLNYEGTDYTVTVTYTEDAQIPDNAELAVREIEKDTEEYAAYLEQAQGAVDETKSVNEARFFDITILADGEKIEPQAPVNVQITFAGIEQTNTDDTQLLHYKDDKEVEVIDQAEFSKSEENEQEAKDSKTVDTVQFETDGFSVYGIVVMETIETQYISASGDTYEITVSYDSDANIPDDAELSVSEVSRIATNEDGEKYSDIAKSLLNVDTGNSETVTLFDISIMKDGQKIQPETPVNVEIRLANGEIDETAGVVHFGNTKTEVLDAAANEDTVTFEASSFSIYAFKTLTDEDDDGIYDLTLSVTGSSSSVTTYNDINVIFVLDNSNSMNYYATSDTGSYVSWSDLTGNGSGTAYDYYRTEGESSGGPGGGNTPAAYVRLYKSDGNGGYTAVEEGDTTSLTELYVRSSYNSNTFNLVSSYSGTAVRVSKTNRQDAANTALTQIMTTLAAKNTENNSANSDAVEMLLITFNGGASTGSWTTTVPTLPATTDRGTWWKEALAAAKTAADAKAEAETESKGAADDTYVIFITDGVPTNDTQQGDHTGTSEATALYNDQYVEGLYLIYAYGFSDSQYATLTALSHTAAYNATSTEALVSALTSILGSINNASTYEEVVYNDGVTSMTSSLVAEDVGEASFTKYRIVKQVDEKWYYEDTYDTSPEEVDSSNVTSLTNSLGTVYYDKTSGEEYTGATVSYENNVLSWDLSGVLLENGWLYTTTFEVWPSQEALDLVADLNNKTVSITSLKDEYKSQIVVTVDGSTYYYKSGTGTEGTDYGWTTDGNNFITTDDLAELISDAEISDADSVSYSLRTNTEDTSINYNAVDTVTKGTLPDGVTSTGSGDSIKYYYGDNELVYDDESGSYIYTDPDTGKTYTLTVVVGTEGTTYTLKISTPGTTPVDNPDPIALEDDEMKVQKLWDDDINKLNQSNGVIFTLWRDGVTYKKADGSNYTITLPINDYWYDTVDVAPGIMTTTTDSDGNTNVTIYETGHNYTLTEEIPSDIAGEYNDYSYEFSSQTVRPMFVNGTLQYLILVQSPYYTAPDGATTYTIETKDGVTGGTYYVARGDEVQTLSGSNHKTSELDITKQIDDSLTDKTKAELDEEIFNYSVTLTLPSGYSGNTGVKLWIYTPAESGSYGLAEYEYNSVTGEKTEVSFTDGAATVTFAINRTQVARFTNLPTGTTYTITETGANGETLASQGYIVNGYGQSEATDNSAGVSRPAITATGDTVTGTISESATRYYTNFENKLTSVDAEIKVTKALKGYDWDDGDDSYSFKLTAGTATYSDEPTGTSPMPEGDTSTVTVNSADALTATFGEIRYTKAGTYVYTITETAGSNNAIEYGGPVTVTVVVTQNDDDGSLSVTGQEGTNSTYTPAVSASGDTAATPAILNGTITNTWATTSAYATKVWQNADGKDTAPEGATVVFTLYEDGVATDYTVTLDGTADETVPTTAGGYESEAWKATFVNLPKCKVTETTVEGVTTRTTEKITYTIVESTGYTGYEIIGSPAANGGTITNKETATLVSLLKIGDSSEDNPLENVQFKLYSDESCTTQMLKDAENQSIGSNEYGLIITGNDGMQNIGTLAVGTYYLVETQEKPGYNKLTETVSITVNSDGSVTYNQETYSPSKSGEGLYEIYKDTNDNLVYVGSTDDSTDVSSYTFVGYRITVNNSSGYELPMTGGPGTFLYTLGGMMLLIASAMMYGFRMRRRERRLN